MDISKERPSCIWRTGIIQWAALAGITMPIAEMSASAADKGSMLMKQPETGSVAATMIMETSKFTVFMVELRYFMMPD